MRIVCLSDTHSKHDQIEVPDGDVVVHAGDFTGRGRLKELREALAWFGALPHKHKVCIVGNHDFLFERDPGAARSLVPPTVHYLQDSGVEIEGKLFWGSPWQPWFHDWAFNLRRGEALARVWEKIPDHTEVLLTHGPPWGYLDVTAISDHVGCEDLERRVLAVNPALHVFGHIHESYGVRESAPLSGRRTIFVNASCLDLSYRPVNAPIVVDL